MRKSTGALSARKRKSPSRKAIAHKLFGAAAVACLVLGCGWTVYSNIISASVYPTLGSADYDEPVIKPPTVASRSVSQAISDAFAALPGGAPAIEKPETVASITPFMFNERFAASEPQSVAPAAPSEPVAAPWQQTAALKLAEAPKETFKETFKETSKETFKETSKQAPKTASAPKLAEAPKPKQAAPAQVAMNVPAPRQPESTPAKAAGDTVSEMAQRAKAAVLSIVSGERTSITEKLWGKQEQRGSLLSFASADASITGSIGQKPNPALGGSAPYERDTAVYDISAHTVYLPDGSKLEAHSGLGSMLDDPGTAKIRMHGVTPPHIYELTPREALFHGVPALRLNPIGGDDAVYGRSGLLAHTFMLGPNGDSNGCVSFRDYNAFLNAYRNQGIKKLAVVARVE
jgi:cell division protein FtsN